MSKCKFRCKESGLALTYVCAYSRSITVVALTLWNTIDVLSAFKQTQDESITLPHHMQASSVWVLQQESEHVSINEEPWDTYFQGSTPTNRTNKCAVMKSSMPSKTLPRCSKHFWTNSDYQHYNLRRRSMQQPRNSRQTCWETLETYNEIQKSQRELSSEINVTPE